MTLKSFSLLAERHNQRVKREDQRAGEVAAMIFNANCDRAKFPNGITWLDVFPYWKEKPVQTEDEMFEAMMMWTKVEPLPS